MKEVFRKTCVQCHTPAFVLQNRFDARGWEKVITLMSRFSVFGGTVREDEAPNPVIRYYTKRLAAYLTETRGPGPSPMKFKPRPRPSGEATLAVVTEYDVPLRGTDVDVSNGSDWSLGTPSHLNPEHHHAHDATPDLDGNIWLTDQALNAIRTVAKVDVKTGAVTPYKVAGPDGMALGTHANVRDQKGFIWSDIQSRPGTLLRSDPRTGEHEVFTPPKGMSGVGAWVNMDGKGRVWANANSGAIMFDPETKEFREFKAPSPRSPDGSSSGYGVAGDRDGNGWWSQFSIDIINKADPNTGKVESIRFPPRETAAVRAFAGDDRAVFELAGSDAFLWATPWSQAPRRMAGDLNGEFIWVPLWHGQSVASVHIKTHEIKYYPIPTLDGGPYELKVDKDHMVWVDFMNSDTVGKLDPKTGKWVEYHLPTLGAETHSIGILDTRGPTEVTLAYFRAGKVARMQFRTAEELRALKAQVAQRTPAF
jgi:streptogramin lyase